MSYRLTGNGPITVVITQGLGLASAEWWPIQDRLSASARVLTWDRPGYGDSSPAHTPRTASNIAREALNLLGVVAPDGPLVLVGHSQGGLYSNAVARTAGPRVKGVVLLDPASPDNGRLRRDLLPELFRRSRSDLSVGLRMGRRMARLHLMRLFKPLMAKQPPLSLASQHSPEARNAMWRQLTQVQAYDVALQEYLELELRTGPHDIDALGPFPRVPLAVLVHDPELMIDQFVKSSRMARADAEHVEGLWGKLLRESASLSPLGTVETVTGSGHLIHLERPDVIVARIGEVMKASVTVH